MLVGPIPMYLKAKDSFSRPGNGTTEKSKIAVKSGNINERYHKESWNLDQSSRCFSSMAGNIKRFSLVLSGNHFNFDELAKINPNP